MQLKIDEFVAEKMIPADDSVRLLDDIMEEMDYTPLMRANKYSFVWKKSTTKYETRLHDKLAKLMPGLCSRCGILADGPEELLCALQSRVTAPFVCGRGKRKSELQRDIELLQELLGQKLKYAGYQETFDGRNSFSKTDPDATFMHMKDDHMRNAQLKPGYNIQLGIEGEYITGVHISSERRDQLALIPLLENMEAHLGRSYGDVTADAGYESEENYTYFEGKATECYIKPQITSDPKRRNTRAIWPSALTTIAANSVRVIVLSGL